MFALESIPIIDTIIFEIITLVILSPPFFARSIKFKLIIQEEIILDVDLAQEICKIYYYSVMNGSYELVHDRC